MRVRIWKQRDSVDRAPDTDPDEVIDIDPETTYLWQDNPRYHSPPLGFDIHPEDRPGTLYVYTSDSVHSPPGYDNHIEQAYWDGPMEQGLPFTEDVDEYRPFGCEVWGRVLLWVEEGLTR